MSDQKQSKPEKQATPADKMKSVKIDGKPPENSRELHEDELQRVSGGLKYTTPIGGGES